MTEPHAWPRLTRVRAQEVHRSVAQFSPTEAREHALRSSSEGPESVERLAGRLRAVADLHGWPSPLHRQVASRVDREWSHALAGEHDITPVIAADEAVWNALALIVVPDLSRWRYPEIGSDRYIGHAGHVFGRLWLYATVLGDDLIDGLGEEPLSEDELVALFRRRDLVASHPVAQAVAAVALASGRSGATRLALVKRITSGLLRESPMIELDALREEDLHGLVVRISTNAESDLGPVPSGDGSPPP